MICSLRYDILMRLAAGARAKLLVAEYNLPDASDSRERNLNAFMGFIGGKHTLLLCSPLDLSLTTFSHVPNGADERPFVTHHASCCV